MALSTQEKSEIFAKHGMHEGDTGSARVQVAMITERLKQLQDHFRANKKDHHSRRGLLKLVGKRRSLLDYVKRKDVKEYRKLIQELGIRK